MQHVAELAESSLFGTCGDCTCTCRSSSCCPATGTLFSGSVAGMGTRSTIEIGKSSGCWEEGAVSLLGSCFASSGCDEEHCFCEEWVDDVSFLWPV